MREGKGSRPEATDVLSESQEGPEMGVPRFHRGEAQGLRVGEGMSELVRSEEDSQENEAGKSLHGSSGTKQPVRCGQHGCFWKAQ